jgi:hypothetical protein
LTGEKVKFGSWFQTMLVDPVAVDLGQHSTSWQEHHEAKRKVGRGWSPNIPLKRMLAPLIT